jgi:hypothetical protein
MVPPILHPTRSWTETAHIMGAPINLRTLWVSVTDPDALIAAVSRNV